MQLQETVGVVYHPSFSINDRMFKGNYKDANYMFKAICSIMEVRVPACSDISISADYYNATAIKATNETKIIEA